MTTSATPGGMRSSVGIGARIRGVDYSGPHDELPAALTRLHRVTAVGGRVRARIAGGWDPAHLQRVVEGAGFSFDDIATSTRGRLVVAATRLRTLPDTVGRSM